MIEVTPARAAWDGDDYKALNDFLKSRTGLRLLPKWLESVSTLLPGGEINAVLIRSGEVRGWQLAAQSLLSLTAPPDPDKPEENPYPPLDDDLAWADGKKIEPPQPE